MNNSFDPIFEVEPDEKGSFGRYIIEHSFQILIVVGVLISLLFFPISFLIWIIYYKESSKRRKRQCEKKHQLRKLREQIESDYEKVD